MLTLAISSCDETTTTMGNSLTRSIDKFTIVSDTFDVETRSIMADSILCRSSYCYLGCIKDPETGSYLTSDYTTQFVILEDEGNNMFVKKEHIISLDDNQQPQADSCIINIMLNSYMGDSLTAMKVSVNELDKPLEENKFYYTNFDPVAEGYLRPNGLRQRKMFSISDLTLSDSIRNLRRKGSYYETIKIPLNEPYTDKQGITYNNYGTYLMRQYFDNPKFYKNSQTFREKVCPGFYFDITDGSGVMTEVYQTQITIYYRSQIDDIVYKNSEIIRGTEEVLQTSHFANDEDNLKALLAETDWTYLKAPDGIFTEVTLPVDKIKEGHVNDTITSARIVFRSMNEVSELSAQMLQEPQNLLMIQRDSLYSFFEERNLPNNITSYVATYNSSKNTYTFNNISGMINNMWAKRGSNENWNKVVLIPVQITSTAASASTTSSSTTTTTTTLASVSNEMRATSVRLIGGSTNRHDPVRISVVYNQTQ